MFIYRDPEQTEKTESGQEKEEIQPWQGEEDTTVGLESQWEAQQQQQGWEGAATSDWAASTTTNDWAAESQPQATGQAW